MKIALISDIHANLQALDAVLQHARSQGVQAIWNAGDSIGYGAKPDLVVRRLREEGVVSVLGNFDRRVLKFDSKKDEWRQTKRPEKFLAFQWAFENLSQVSKQYLESLPRELILQLGKSTFLLTHGSPDSIKDTLGPDTPDKKLKKLTGDSEAQFFLCGQSHRTFFRMVKNGCFINPGSVGLQRDGDPRASYAVLDLPAEMMIAQPEREVDLQMHPQRVVYDVEQAAESIREAGLPEAYAQCLIQGKSLSGVLREPEKWQIPGPDDESWWATTFKSLNNRKEEEDRRLDEVIELAEEYGCNLEHIQQATHLALRLFDELQPLHRLGPDERYWLRCAALLHDIGKPQGNKGHHKAALEMILNAPELPFQGRDRKIIGLIARYHRSAWPKQKHDHFVSLPAVDQRKVTILSSILRVADGLDSPRRGNVIDLQVYFSPEEITIISQVREQAKKERKRALGKGELMEFAFGRDLYIEWHRV